MKKNNCLILLLFIIFLLFAIFIVTRRKIYPHDPVIIRLRNDVVKLDPNIAELEFYASNESFTEDKKKIYLCLKDENGKYYNYNMLIYVTIHECAHALTTVIDTEHTTPQFHDKFDQLLLKAQNIGIYDPSQPLTDGYCGLPKKA